MMIDYMFDHRDDKKRKAFQRGGPQKPKVQPAYEKVWIHFLRKNKNEIFIYHLLGTHREIPHRVKGQVKNKFDDLVLSFLHLQIGAGMDLKHLLQVLLATSPPQALKKNKNSNKDKIGVTFVFLAKVKNKTKFNIHDHLYFHQR